MIPANITNIVVKCLNLPLRQMQVTWELSTDPSVTEYRVYRSEISYGDFDLIATLPSFPSSNMFTDTTVPVTAPLPFEWFYKVTAVSVFGESNLATTLPSPAQGIHFFLNSPIKSTIPQALSEQNLLAPKDSFGAPSATSDTCSTAELQQLPTTTVNPRWFLQIRQRNKWALEMGGVPVVILKRRWSGTLCPNYDVTRGQHRTLSVPTSTDTCYDTNFVHGYHVPLTILVSFVSPQLKSVTRNERGMWMELEPKSWTLWEPNLLERDVLVRPDTGERFEVMNVTRNLFRGQSLRQSFDAKLIEPTNIIYRIPIA